MVDQDERDRLRVLFFDELEQLRGLGLLHQFERIAVLERPRTGVRHVVGLAGAERALEDLLRGLDPALVDVLERDRALYASWTTESRLSIGTVEIFAISSTMRSTSSCRKT